MKKIKEWYVREYPTDDLGANLNSEITFEDLFVAIETNEDVYEVLNVRDSIVRERVFGELARIMDVSYDYIYDSWRGPII